MNSVVLTEKKVDRQLSCSKLLTRGDTGDQQNLSIQIPIQTFDDFLCR